MNAKNLSMELVESFCSKQFRAPAVFEFLHRYGRCMAVSPDNQDFERGSLGQCYANSSRMALFTGLTYCEGYAVPGGIGVPIEHAWLCDEKGHVIDPTWSDGSDYFGVPFTEEFHAQLTAETGYYGLLCNLYRLRTFSTKDELLRYLASGVAQPCIEIVA